MQLAARSKEFMEFASKWLAIEEKGDWLNAMRGNLATVATVIATMTFQVGLNPPGGVVQSGDNGIVDCPLEWRRNQTQACPGTSVLGGGNYEPYFRFMLFNNISFFSSLIVCLWLLSGLPLNHRFPTWLMATAMSISLISFSLAYVYGVDMIKPYATWAFSSNYSSFDFFVKSYKSSRKTISIWVVLSEVVVGIVAFFLVLRCALLFVAIITGKSSEALTSTTPSETEVNRS